MKRRNTHHQVELAFESLKNVPPPDEARQASARQTFLAQARSMHAELTVDAYPAAHPGKWYKRPLMLGTLFFRQREFRTIAVIAAFVMALGLASVGVVYASDASRPGDALYGIDRAVEGIRLGLAADTETAFKLHLEFAAERLEEATDELAKEGDATEIKSALVAYVQGIETVVQMLASADPADRSMLIAHLLRALSTQETDLQGMLLSSPEQVRQPIQSALDITRDGLDRASSAANQESDEAQNTSALDESGHRNTRAEFRGTLDSINGQAVVCGVPFVLEANTEIDGSPAVGDSVKVEFVVQSDGSFLATEIEVELEEEECELRVEGLLAFRGDMDGNVAWTIEGISLFVNQATDLRGNPQEGDLVKARAVPDLVGNFIATRVETERDDQELDQETAEVRFEGIIQSMSVDTWLVGGRTVALTAATDIRGIPMEGLLAEVRANVQADGTLVAWRIDVEDEAPEAEEPEAGEEQALEVRFEGVIQSISGDTWLVGGRTVEITVATDIRGIPMEGLLAEVRANVQAEGSLVAWRIDVENEVPEADEEQALEVRFEGVIQSISGDTWQVGGRTVTLTAATDIRGIPMEGLLAEVRANVQADGSLVAWRIDVEDE